MHNVILPNLHNDIGHPGRDKTVNLVRERFYWPKMHSDISRWIDDCERCIKFKTPHNQKAELVNITTSQPLEMVCMDYMTL